MYINKNYEKQICCIESPHKPDSLILKSDGTLSSNFFGIGTYKINYGILETGIELHYENKNGKAGHYTYFVNRLFEKPKIIMNSDTNHYFEKRWYTTEKNEKNFYINIFNYCKFNFIRTNFE